MTKRIARLALVAVAAAGVQAAQAQAAFSLVSAYYTLDSSGPFNFTFVPNGPAMTVDFLSAAPAFKVGDSTTFGSGTATIIYNVVSQVPIIGIDLTFQGNVNQFGEINYTETAETGLTTNLGVISGVRRGSAYAGGLDGAFTVTQHLTFSQAVTTFKVKKSFDLDIGPNRPPSTSLAEVNFVEQNLTPVPEPATMGILAVGALGYLARRKKRV